ncbi:hypothetical protein D3C87_1312730 [compost metagenome]
MPGIRYPATAFLAQHAAQLLLEELVDAPGVGADHLPEHRQRGVTAGGGKGVAPGKRALPVTYDRPLPLAVEAGHRGLQHPLPGLLQRLHEQGLADAVPLGAEAGGEQAAVGLGVGEVDAVALEHALRQGLGHRLGIGRVAHLLQLQAHPGDAVEEGLQAQALAVVLAVDVFAQQGQQRAKGGVQWAAAAGHALIDHRHWLLAEQLLRRLHQRVGQRLTTGAGLALISQGVHQSDQRRLAHIAHQRQLVDHLAEAVHWLPAQLVEEVQPGVGVVLEIAFGQALLELLRA